MMTFQQELAMSPAGSGIIISNVPPMAADRANGGISAMATLFRFWDAPVLSIEEENQLAASMNQLMIPPEDVMVDLADRVHLWTFSFYATFAEVEDRLLAGIPILAMIQDHPADASSRRYVIIFGFIRDGEKLVVREDMMRTTVYGYGEFKRMWRPVRNWCMVICPPERIRWTPSRREQVARALFYERTGQWKSALADLDDLQSRNPENVNIMLAKARIHLREKNTDAAMGLYRNALSIDPVNARAANNLAFVLLESGQDLPEAERWSRRALTIEPSNPLYLDTLGAILLMQEQPAEAAVVLEKARYRSGNLPVTSRREIDVRLMRAFIGSGQAHLARQIRADVLREDPTFEIPADVKDALP